MITYSAMEHLLRKLYQCITDFNVEELRTWFFLERKKSGKKQLDASTEDRVLRLGQTPKQICTKRRRNFTRNYWQEIRH